MGVAEGIGVLFAERLNKADVLNAFALAMVKNEARILELNKRQMDKGIDAEGRSLGRYRDFDYKGRFEPVDLLLTGSFRQKMEFSSITADETEISSTDEKTGKLKAKYGEDIFGVQDIEQVGSVIKRDFQKFYREELL